MIRDQQFNYESTCYGLCNCGKLPSLIGASPSFELKDCDKRKGDGIVKVFHL